MGYPIPHASVPVVDLKTGLMTAPWFLYFSKQPPLESDTWTPTHSTLVNLDGTTPRLTQYAMVGNFVYFAGEFSANPTAAVLTSFRMTLPIARADNFATTFQCGGAGASDAASGYSVRISAVVGAKTALVSWIAADLTNQPISFSGGYFLT